MPEGSLESVQQLDLDEQVQQLVESIETAAKDIAARSAEDFGENTLMTPQAIAPLATPADEAPQPQTTESNDEINTDPNAIMHDDSEFDTPDGLGAEAVDEPEPLDTSRSDEEPESVPVIDVAVNAEPAQNELANADEANDSNDCDDCDAFDTIEELFTADETGAAADPVPSGEAETTEESVTVAESDEPDPVDDAPAGETAANATEPALAPDQQPETVDAIEAAEEALDNIDEAVDQLVEDAVEAADTPAPDDAVSEPINEAIDEAAATDDASAIEEVASAQPELAAEPDPEPGPEIETIDEIEAPEPATEEATAPDPADPITEDVDEAIEEVEPASAETAPEPEPEPVIESVVEDIEDTDETDAADNIEEVSLEEDATDPVAEATTDPGTNPDASPYEEFAIEGDFDSVGDIESPEQADTDGCEAVATDDTDDHIDDFGVETPPATDEADAIESAPAAEQNDDPAADKPKKKTDEKTKKKPKAKKTAKVNSPGLIAAMATRIAPITASVFLLANAPFRRLGPFVNQTAGWLAINTAFLAVCVLIVALLR